ncbi:hypothetical protein BDV93DRAFT_369525 [Ceratobasidium sp. AG-I]|nr:hypothetical protein BDV93DRAFT_369525 [Ceratobasidium sp. AG-I]
MGKVKSKTRRAAKKKTPSPEPPAVTPDPSPEPADLAEKLPGKPRVKFTFEILRDLIIILCDKQPWAAAHGTTGRAWTEIAETLNDRYSLDPRAGPRTVQKKASQLRQLQEETPLRTSVCHSRLSSTLRLPPSWIHYRIIGQNGRRGKLEGYCAKNRMGFENKCWELRHASMHSRTCLPAIPAQLSLAPRLQLMRLLERLLRHPKLIVRRGCVRNVQRPFNVSSFELPGIMAWLHCGWQQPLNKLEAP